MDSLDALIADALNNALFDLVDAGVVDEDSHEFNYWHGLVRNGDSREV